MFYEDFFITSKLNFKSGRFGRRNGFDDENVTENGCEVTAVTVFSDFNDIDRPLPYEVKKENIGFMIAWYTVGGI